MNKEMNKGDIIVIEPSGRKYTYVGVWGDAMIFSPLEPDHDTCILYTDSEVEELLERGEFRVWRRN